MIVSTVHLKLGILKVGVNRVQFRRFIEQTAVCLYTHLGFLSMEIEERQATS